MATGGRLYTARAIYQDYIISVNRDLTISNNVV